MKGLVVMPTKDREANARHQRAWRNRQRGGPPRPPKPCGTHGGFRRHERNDETPCAECRKAFNRYARLSRLISASDDPDAIAKLRAERDQYK